MPYNQSISLEGLQFDAFHGVHAIEHRLGGTFEVDITICTNLEKASQTDAIEDTVDYEQVYAIIEGEMQQRSNLLEHLAERIIQKVKKEFPEAGKVKIKISKIKPFYNKKCKKSSVFIEK